MYIHFYPSILIYYLLYMYVSYLIENTEGEHLKEDSSSNWHRGLSPCIIEWVIEHKEYCLECQFFLITLPPSLIRG